MAIGGSAVFTAIIRGDSSQAVTSFKKFEAQAKATVDKAGGFKSAVGGAFDFVKNNAMTLAAAGGAAVAAFAAKSVSAFQDTALAAKRFSDATGVAVEDASRWIEIAGDVGISAESIQGAFGKLNLALAKGSLRKYGIDATDASEGFLQVAEAMRQIKDPTERGLLAQQAFGRGYQQVAELTAMSAKDLRKALDEVSDAKVIDEKEAQKAVRLRAAMDQLSDAVQDVQLAFGEALIPTLTALADVVSKAVDVIERAKDATGGDDGLLGSLEKGLNPVKGLGDAFGKLNEAFGDTEDKASEAAPAIDQLAVAQERAAESADSLASYQESVARATDGVSEALARQKNALNDATSATLAQFDAQFAVKDAQAQQLTALVEYNDAVAEYGRGSWAAAEAQDGAAKAALDAAGAVAELATKQGEASGVAVDTNAIIREELKKTAQSLASDDPLRRQLQDYIDQLDNVQTDVSTKVKADVSAAQEALRSVLSMLARISGSSWVADVGTRRVGVGATGGIVTRPTLSVIGEAGPEAVVPLSRMPGASSLPSVTAGSGAPVINVYALAPQQAADAVVEALSYWNRRNGALPVAVAA